MDELILRSDVKVTGRQVLDAGTECPVLVVLVVRASAKRRIVGHRVVTMPSEADIGAQVVVNVQSTGGVDIRRRSLQRRVVHRATNVGLHPQAAHWIPIARKAKGRRT